MEPIGRGQKAGEDAAIARAEAQGAPLVVLDTDLVSTVVYSRHYYGDCPRWIEEDAARRLADLYLLHHVDVEWVADGRQREQPERRGELFERFRATLAGLGARVADVAGPWDERRLRAVEALGRPAGRAASGGALKRLHWAGRSGGRPWTRACEPSWSATSRTSSTTSGREPRATGPR